MVDATTPSISFSIEETLSQLDALYQPRRDRMKADFEALQSMVGNLDTNWGSDDDAFAPQRTERPPESSGRATPPSPVPFVALPRRTTRGGPFGPKVRDKLIREALDKGNW